MTTRLYISGPMSGYPDLNAQAFIAATTALRTAGYEVVSPQELGEPEGWAHQDFMRRDLRHVLDCGGLAMLPGAEWSRGALAEVAAAHSAGLTVMPLHVWLRKAMPWGSIVAASASAQ